MSIVNLPSGYRQVEYIESSGTQYIDTGFMPNHNSRAVADVQFMSFPSSHSAIFGAYDSTNQWWAYYRYDQSQYRAVNGGTTQKSISYTDPTVRAILDLQSGLYRVNDTEITWSQSEFSINHSAYLFALNSSSSAVKYQAACKLFSCQIYDNGTLVRDFIPCINPSGVVGLYDLVNAKFYGNSGTGVFTAGPYLTVDTPANFEQILAVYLRWGAVDCEAYKIYRDGSLIGTTTNTFYVDITAEQNTEYTYTLIAYRGATESEPTELTVYTRSGYFVIKPLIESAFFQ